MGYEEVPAASGIGVATLFLWGGAAVALLLLVILGIVVETLTSRRKDFAVRVLRAFFFLLFPATYLLPALYAGDEYGVELGLGLLFYVVLLSVFWYCFGRRTGWDRGRKSISDLVGLDNPDSVEDAQDRLFESRLRYPNRADVVKSIGKLAKTAEAGRGAKERASSKQSSVALDVEVQVEGLFEDE